MAEEMKNELNQRETQVEELDNKDSEQVSGGSKWKKTVMCYVPGCNFSTTDPVAYRDHMQTVHGQQG